MKRLFNVRLPVLLTFALALGILAEYFFCYYRIDIFWIIAVVPLTALFFVVFLILKKIKYAVFAVLVLVALIIGFFNCYYRFYIFEKNDVLTETSYYIMGTVAEKGATDYGEYIVLKNVTAEGQKLSGKMLVYLSQTYGDFCDEGYRVSFISTVTQSDLFPFGELHYNAEQNVKYTCTVYSGLKSEYKFSLFAYLRTAIRNVIFDNLSEQTAPVFYAMLTGKTQFIEAGTLASFRYGGIAHIFAVSGLHIGIIYGLLRKTAKILTVNKYVSAVAVVSLIILYAGMCGFSLSSVRAVIMCSALITADLFHVKNDGFNSLAVAVFAILCLTPLSLFSIGFQLSVCAMGGIFMFANKINRLLSKIKIPRKIGGSIGTALGAQIGTTPVMLSGFGYVSGAGLLLNIALLPLLSLLFTVFFAGVVISLIIPPLAFILPYLALPLESVISFLVEFGFENALIKGFGSGLFIPVYYAGALLISDKLNFRWWLQPIIFALVAGALTAIVLLQTYSPFEGHNVIISGNNSGGNVIIKSPQGTVMIVTEYANFSRVTDSQNKFYASELDAIILLGGDELPVKYNLEYGCENVYLSNLIIPVQPYPDLRLNYVQSFTLCGVDFGFEDSYSIMCDVDGVKIAVCAGEIPFGYCDILISCVSNVKNNYGERYCSAQTEIYFNLKKINYSIYECGDMVYKVHNKKYRTVNYPRSPY